MERRGIRQDEQPPRMEQEPEVISRYTDAQALEDGVLVAVDFAPVNRVTRSVFDHFARPIDTSPAKGAVIDITPVRKVIEAVTDLTCCDVLYIGGGNARKLAIDMPAHVRIVSNTAGITGGIRLWEPELDELFRGEPMAQAQYNARQP